MKQKIKEILKKIYIARILRFFVTLKKRIGYEMRNHKKQMIVGNIAKKSKYKIFIETGTYMGDMVMAMKNKFSKIYSIELSSDLYNSAKKRFVNYQNIKLLCGDSGKILPQILNEINEPILFWLDAHYSSGKTARGDKDTPIIQELETIFAHKVKKHIILIDDARCFISDSDYPEISYLKQFVHERAPQSQFEVKEDIIRIIPES